MAKQKSAEITRLKQLFDEIGLDIDTVADDTGVSKRTIQNFLWNDLPIGGQLLRQLHQCYGVSIDWLLSGTGDRFYGQHNPVKRKSLIPDFEQYDTRNAQDAFIVAAKAIEQSLTQCGSVPGDDYSRLDLFNLAKPFVLERFKEAGNDLAFFG